MKLKKSMFKEFYSLYSFLLLKRLFQVGNTSPECSFNRVKINTVRTFKKKLRTACFLLYK